VGVVLSGTRPQTPLPPRRSRPTSPARDESVCSRACRDCEPRRVRVVGTSVGVGGWGRPGGPGDCPPGRDRCGRPPPGRSLRACPPGTDACRGSVAAVDLEGRRPVRPKRTRVADRRSCRGGKSVHAREHTHSSRAGEVGRDPRGRKGVCGPVPLGTTLAVALRPRIVSSSHGFYGKNHPRRPQLRGWLTTEKPGMKKARRGQTTAASSAVLSARTQTPLPPRKSRPTSPTQDESVCSHACRDCEPHPDRDSASVSTRDRHCRWPQPTPEIRRPVRPKRTRVADRRSCRGEKSVHAREHTDSSCAGEVGRDSRGHKSVCGNVPPRTTLAVVRKPRIVFSSHGFYGERARRSCSLRGWLTIKKTREEKSESRRDHDGE
jgi:hypothetical protein